MDKISELIQKTHSQAKDRGEWDAPVSIGEKLMLIVSACGRALEACESDRRFNNDDYMTGIALYTEDNKRHKFGSKWPLKAAFQRYVEHTFEYELANVAIGIASISGQIIPFEKKLPTPKDIENYGIEKSHVNLGEQLLIVVSHLMSIGAPFTSDRDNLAAAIMKIFQIAKYYEADLWLNIELNLSYNKSK